MNGVFMPNDKNIDFILRTIEERQIRFIRLWFTDVLGNLKSLAVSPEDIEEAFEEGISFDGSAINGFTPYEQSDMLIFPDPTTFQILPWSDGGKTARMICDVKTPQGDPFEGDPRACLRRMFEKALSQGYLPVTGPEFEYFYFKDPSTPTPVDDAEYFDLTPFDSKRNTRRNTTQTLEKMGIPVAYSYHAVGPSQHGIQLRLSESGSCADNIMTARFVIKQEAYTDGMYASFMPKPFADKPGNAFFIHQSLFDTNGKNLFWGGESEEGVVLSDLAKHYIAGLLKYAPEISLVTNPTVNSYKRLIPSGQVPVYANWGRKNRSAYVRIPTFKPGKVSSVRAELRMPDSTCNPYLAFAVTLAAGLKGIEEKLELPEETSGSVFNEQSMSDMAQSCVRLPRNLGEAISHFENSELMRETLGDHIFNYLLETKKAEWTDYNSFITDWEIKRHYAGF